MEQTQSEILCHFCRFYLDQNASLIGEISSSEYIRLALQVGTAGHVM